MWPWLQPSDQSLMVFVSQDPGGCVTSPGGPLSEDGPNGSEVTFVSEKKHFLWALVRLRVRLRLLDSVIDFLSRMPLRCI